MDNFKYDESELPEVSGSDGYYNSGSWTLSDLKDEDGDIENVRESILAWIAWYNFLAARDGGEK